MTKQVASAFFEAYGLYATLVLIACLIAKELLSCYRPSRSEMVARAIVALMFRERLRLPIQLRISRLLNYAIVPLQAVFFAVVFFKVDTILTI